jgi:hypothetical protein
LLSEGVNLQDANVVVHLDLPWTAARLEQRLGRVRRLGSIHKRVHAYGIRPSTAAEALINLERTIERKMREAERSVGGAQRLLPSTRASRVRSPIAAAERIREILRGWIIAGSRHANRDATIAASVTASRSGFLALIGEEPDFMLLASSGARVTEDPLEILDLLAHATDTETEATLCAASAALERIQISLQRMRALDSFESGATSVARNRRKLLARIADIVQSARPHQRQRFQSLANEARKIVLDRMSAAAESDLLALAASPLPNEAWLEQIIRDGKASTNRTAPTLSGRVVAILLLDCAQSH